MKITTELTHGEVQRMVEDHANGDSFEVLAQRYWLHEMVVGVLLASCRSGENYADGFTTTARDGEHLTEIATNPGPIDEAARARGLKLIQDIRDGNIPEAPPLRTVEDYQDLADRLHQSKAERRSSR